MKNSVFLALAPLLVLLAGCVSMPAVKVMPPAEEVVPAIKTPPREIAQAVEAIINKTDPNVNIGVLIAELDSNDVVFEKNAERYFVPASTIKLVTLASALYYLGPSYRFSTTLFTDQVLDHKTLNNLYIQGSGDPSLMDYDLMMLASELKQMGITNIAGSIFIDDQVFDDVLWTSGTMWDDRKNGYSAPISGLNLNYNRIVIKTKPGFHDGKSAYSIVQPRTSYIDITSRTLTASSGHNIKMSVERGKDREDHWPSVTNDGLHQGDRVIISGETSKSSDPYYTMLSVSDPGMLSATFLKDELRHLGIDIRNKTSRRPVPSNAIRLAVHESRSLAEALIDFTKISNNIANDALVKAIAAEAGVKPATFSAGLKLINDFLADKVGIKSSSFINTDGAGLSRYNLMTPGQMVKLLSYAANHFHMGPEFMAALPIGGEDGTLGKRFTSDAARGHIRAKTGHMSGMTNLAGFLIGEDGKRYAFALMTNGIAGPIAKYKDMHEQILGTFFTSDQTAVAKAK